MKAATTDRWRRRLNALALAGALLPQAAGAAELLSYCLNQIESIGLPQGTPLQRHRQFGQLVLLQDQLKYLAQTGDSDDLGRCTLALHSAMAHYRPQPTTDPRLLSLEAQLIHLDKRPLKAITIGSERCWQGLDAPASRTLDLEAHTISRYLNQADDALCRERVWVAYQNRATPDAEDALRHYREAAQQRARQGRFASDARWQLRGTPLTAPEQVRAFLDRQIPDDRRPPWDPAPDTAPLSLPPGQLAMDALRYLAGQFGLTLEPIDDHQWQLWDGRRLLGYLELQAGDHARQSPLQSHWIGVSPAVVQLVYRERPWYPRHWHQWMAQTAETLVSMAGSPLPYDAPSYSGAGYGYGRALARAGSVQQQLLGQTLPFRPLIDAAALYEAQMGLAVATQQPWSPSALKRTSDALFQRYFARPAPQGLKPWPGHSDWAIAGARAYLPLWHAEQGKALVTRRLSGALTADQLWQRLTQPSLSSTTQATKNPAEFAGPFGG